MSERWYKGSYVLNVEKKMEEMREETVTCEVKMYVPESFEFPKTFEGRGEKCGDCQMRVYDSLLIHFGDMWCALTGGENCNSEGKPCPFYRRDKETAP